MFPSIVQALVQARTASRRGALAGRDLAARDAEAADARTRQAARDQRDQQGFETSQRMAEWQLGSEAREEARRRRERQAQRPVLERLAGPDASQLAGLDDEADVSPIVQALVERQRDQREFGQQTSLQDRSFAQQARMQAAAEARAARQAATRATAPRPARPASEGERTAASYLIRMNAAGQALDKITPKDIPNPLERAMGRLPMVGNSAVDENYQLWRQAGEEFIASVLRKESGAAISDQEFDRYAAIYLPMPGDGPATTKRKAEARLRALQQMSIGAGSALSEVQPLLDQQRAGAGAAPTTQQDPRFTQNPHRSRQ